MLRDPPPSLPLKGGGERRKISARKIYSVGDVFRNLAERLGSPLIQWSMPSTDFVKRASRPWKSVELKSDKT